MTSRFHPQSVAYALFACRWDEGARKFLDEVQGDPAGHFELLLSSEDSSQVEDYGKYESSFLRSWGLAASRIAVIQSTFDWDPRPDFMDLFEAYSAELLYSRIAPRRLPSVIPTAIVYSIPGSIESAIAQELARVVGSIDEVRFWRIVERTVRLAAETSSAILFLAQEGWSYEIDTPADRHKLLTDAGFMFVDRHP